jgi:hypothetical protein
MVETAAAAGVGAHANQDVCTMAKPEVVCHTESGAAGLPL